MKNLKIKNFGKLKNSKFWNIKKFKILKNKKCKIF